MPTRSLLILCQTPELQFEDEHSTFTVGANSGLLALPLALSVTADNIVIMGEQKVHNIFNKTHYLH